MNKKIIVLMIIIVLIIYILLKCINSTKKDISNEEIKIENIIVEEIEDIQSNSIKYKVYDKTTNEILMELTEEEKETINMYQYDPDFYMGDGISEQ